MAAVTVFVDDAVLGRLPYVHNDFAHAVETSRSGHHHPAAP
jgi:hypothetical protein